MTTAVLDAPARPFRHTVGASPMTDPDCAAWLAGYREVLAVGDRGRGRADARRLLAEIAARATTPADVSPMDRGRAFACAEVLGLGTGAVRMQTGVRE